MGDFNFPKLNWENDWPQDLEGRFIDCINDNFLIQKVSLPTRDREGQNSNILDLILVNENELISDITHTEPID